MNISLVLKAVEFAAQKHRDQRRKDIQSSPYINHPISVALLIAQVGNIEDPEILAAALLHDTLEDTDTSVSELLEEFSEAVANYVQEVSDDKFLPKDERKQIQIDHAANLSRGATIVKLGDKISNVTDVTYSPPKGWDTKRRTEYLDWAEAVISNCAKVNKPLETHFFKVLREGREAVAQD